MSIRSVCGSQKTTVRFFQEFHNGSLKVKTRELLVVFQFSKHVYLSALVLDIDNYIFLSSSVCNRRVVCFIWPSTSSVITSQTFITQVSSCVILHFIQ